MPRPPTPTLFPYTTLFRYSSAATDRGLSGKRPARCTRRDTSLSLVAVPAKTASGGDSEVSRRDRKSTRLNSSHLGISYAVLCLKKKNEGVYRSDDASQVID